VVGQIIGTALENAQLSEKRLQQERLAALGEAIAGTSHCMRNLLTGMSVSVEMLEAARQKESWETFDRSLFTLKRSVGRFAEQVNNMLGWSRETELHLVPVNVNDIAAEALHEVEALAHRHRIQIMFKRGALESVPLDGAMIYRVLLNLLGNAIEACGTQGGSVTLSTFQNEIFTRFSVTDTGSGILPEHQERIFDAFFTTKGGGGTGLGLAVSRRMIREHGGDIRVSSKYGEGARFSVVLPHKLLQERYARQVASRPSERQAK
jgi:signal transduction histidine kinase